MKYLILIFVLFALSSCQDYKDITYEVGFRGKARVNPYLAAERMLAYDVDAVRSSPGWSSYDVDTSFALLPASALPVEANGRRLLNWVADGGHLVCVLEAGEGTYNDWGWSSKIFRDELADFEGLTYILNQLDLELYDLDSPEALRKTVASKASKTKTSGKESSGKGAASPSPSAAPSTPAPAPTPVTSSKPSTPTDKTEYYEMYPKPSTKSGDMSAVKILGASLNVEFDGPLRLKYQQGLSDEEYGTLDQEDEERELYRFLSLTYGEYGRVSFVNHARPFRNAYIQNEDNGEFLLQLVDLSYEGDGVLVYAGGSSLFSMLKKYAWRVLLMMVLFLILWLMRSFIRFGPIRELPDDTRQSYSHHLSATGNFLWNSKKSDVLLDQLRDEVMAKFDHAQGRNSDVERDPLFETFAEKLGMPVERVIEAFSRKNVTDGSAMIRIVADLKRMKSIL